MSGQGLCPFCGQPDIARDSDGWRCKRPECGHTFPSPSYGSWRYHSDTPEFSYTRSSGSPSYGGGGGGGPRPTGPKNPSRDRPNQWNTPKPPRRRRSGSTYKSFIVTVLSIALVVNGIVIYLAYSTLNLNHTMTLVFLGILGVALLISLISTIRTARGLIYPLGSGRAFISTTWLAVVVCFALAFVGVQPLASYLEGLKGWASNLPSAVEEWTSSPPQAEVPPPPASPPSSPVGPSQIPVQPQQPTVPKIQEPTTIVPTPPITPIPGPVDIVQGIDFRAIDAHALATPESMTTSIESLAEYLTGPATTELEKVRVIYRWITNNISYDVNSYFTGRYGSTSPDAVLSSRTSICDGYAGLFLMLAQAADLEAVKISGWAKGYGYTVGEPIIGNTDHAWNAVNIDGGWYFVECTWGAGNINEARQYVKDFQDFYFLTPPEKFIYDHLPEDPTWQLLEVKISKAEYAQLPSVQPEYFTYGLNNISHKQCVINATDSATINIAAPVDTVITANIEQYGVPIPDHFCFIQQDAGIYSIDLTLPQPGHYNLIIYAKSRGAEGYYDGAEEYLVVASAGAGNAGRFPETYSAFIESGAYLFNPMSGVLPAGTPQFFKVQVPGALAVEVIVNDQWYPLSKHGEVFEGTVTISRGQIQVCAKFPGRGDYYDTLVEYVSG